MNHIKMRKHFRSKVTDKIIIIIVTIVLIYLLISFYFSNHFFFNTEINGVNLSLKAYKDADRNIRNYLKDYELQLIERDNESEIISGQVIGMQYNEKNSIPIIYQKQRAFYWITSLVKVQRYYINDLYQVDQDDLAKKINKLHCINKKLIEPRNVEFEFINGTYSVVNEIYGNKVKKSKLRCEIRRAVFKGRTSLDLDNTLCYENPKYTLNSAKTLQTKNLLNKYVSTNITYIFGNDKELVDGNVINKWISIDDNLNAKINKIEVMKYVKWLSKKYDTVGITRNFKTSTGKVVEVKGGIYGWKINRENEMNAILENIKRGEVIEKEPIYSQEALSRGEDEIGNTYVEINISRQHLWFYKDGKLITHGAVVTGNPNRGNATVTGTYMLNYKQDGTTLKGAGYEVNVKYWMPFYGNMGIHDASWRHSFGGEIYKRKGTHGCVNAPIYLAKTIFENIEPGIPVICYEE